MPQMTAEEIRQQYALTTPPPPAPLLMPQAPVRRTTPAITIEQVIETVVEDVVVRPLAAPGKTHVVVQDEEWTWEELRSYVVGAITERFGVFPRDNNKEMGIFKSFISRHGSKSAAIAKFAFEAKGGYWKGAPIAVTRFCKGSDPYFAEPIKQTLANHAAQ